MRLSTDESIVLLCYGCRLFSRFMWLCRAQNVLRCLKIDRKNNRSKLLRVEAVLPLMSADSPLISAEFWLDDVTSSSKSRLLRMISNVDELHHNKTLPQSKQKTQPNKKFPSRTAAPVWLRKAISRRIQRFLALRRCLSDKPNKFLWIKHGADVLRNVLYTVLVLWQPARVTIGLNYGSGTTRGYISRQFRVTKTLPSLKHQIL